MQTHWLNIVILYSNALNSSEIEVISNHFLSTISENIPIILFSDAQHMKAEKIEKSYIVVRTKQPALENIYTAVMCNERVAETDKFQDKGHTPACYNKHSRVQSENIWIF